MPFRLIAFVTKLPSLTTDEFITHYEDIHMPLVQKLTGGTFPISHKRIYVRDNLLPHADAAEYDCIVECEFADQAAFYAYLKAVGAEEAIGADQAKFISGMKGHVAEAFVTSG